MKRYVLLVGGAGARLADALICAGCAGIFPAERLHVLLADTDRRGVRSAGLAAAKMADYRRIQQSVREVQVPFRTELTFASWPDALPGDASTLSSFSAQNEADQWLCQALFDQDAASLDLHEGFHGRRTLGEVVFAGLIHEADQNMHDPLACMVDEMASAVQDGEEVRVVLAGSVCGGTGAAGMAALARYIRRRSEGKVCLNAVLLGPCADEQDASAAHDALTAYAQEDLFRAACVLALPQASRASSPADYAQLTDWLAVYAMDMLLHRPGQLQGVFTVKAPAGPLTWEIFGKAAERYRLCYGGLLKAACAWVGDLGGRVEHRLQHPFFLRDSLLGWYAHFFRRMDDAAREEQLALIEPMNRLMNVCLLWLGGICKTLPIDLCAASALEAARSEAAAHYRELTDLSGRLAAMESDALRNELYEDNLVYRSKNSADAAETEAALRRITAAQNDQQRRSSVQQALNRKMGGAAAMDMLYDALDAARQESRDLHDKYDEAVRRIDHAESIASPEDQYRITDARTKLRRMEHRQTMLDSRLKRIEEDVAQAEADGLRFEKPSLTPGPVENGIIPPDMAERLLHRDQLNRRSLRAIWPGLVRPQQTMSYQQTLRHLRRAPADAASPLMSLLTALMESAMKEV